MYLQAISQLLIFVGNSVWIYESEEIVLSLHDMQEITLLAALFAPFALIGSKLSEREGHACENVCTKCKFF